MAATSLPENLPHTMDQLIEELDQLNPPPVVDGILTSDDQIQRLIFDAGRRSIVDELLRLLALTKE